MNFQLFEGAQDDVTNWRPYVACYYPTTPTDYPSTTRRSYEKCRHNISVFGRGLGGTFWPLNESLTFKSPDAQQLTAVNRMEVNKIPPNFDTLFAATLVVIRLFKGLTAQPL